MLINKKWLSSIYKLQFTRKAHIDQETICKCRSLFPSLKWQTFTLHDEIVLNLKPEFEAIYILAMFIYAV